MPVVVDGGVETRAEAADSPEFSEAIRDGDLLRRFVAARDPVAFEGLVRRHGPMVFGVCRRMLRNPHDADDAFQATFLVLLRKAETVRPAEGVGRWLYGVACRTAGKANTMNLQRRRKENQTPPRIELPSDDDRLELRGLLDAELARMPERYRAPIVMCELNGMSRRDAALALRLAEGTLSSRLSRARDLLRTRLTRRGLVALSAGALVAGLTAESVSASASLPASLVAATARGVSQSSKVLGASPDPVALLARGVIKAMWISKVQFVAATTFLIGTLGTGAGLVTHQVLAKEKEAAAAKKGGEKTPGDSVNTTVSAIDASAGTLTASIPEPGKKVPPTTLKLAKDVRVELAPMGKKGEAQPTAGTLADVTPGTSVVLKLSEDRSTVTHISVSGENIRGHIKSLDSAKNTVTFTKDDKNASDERTLPLHASARLTFAGAGKNKQEAAIEAKPSDLASGTPVAISISPDHQSIVSITIEGKSAAGAVAAIDAAKRTLTVSTKGENGPTDQSYTVAPDAMITVGQEKNKPGSLADVTVGMAVSVQLSPREPKSVTSLHAWMPVQSEKSEK